MRIVIEVNDLTGALDLKTDGSPAGCLKALNEATEATRKAVIKAEILGEMRIVPAPAGLGTGGH